MDNLYLIILLIFLLIYSCVVSYYCYRFAVILIKLEDVVEESLVKLESIRSQFVEILEIPVFFDSVEIRKCIQLIKTAKVIVEEVILGISNISPPENIDSEINIVTEEKEEVGIENTRKKEGS